MATVIGSLGAVYNTATLKVNINTFPPSNLVEFGNTSNNFRGAATEISVTETQSASGVAIGDYRSGRNKKQNCVAAFDVSENRCFFVVRDKDGNMLFSGAADLTSVFFGPPTEISQEQPV